MKISYNAPAMRASNALNASDSKVSKSLQRLSSGLKVTTSKDNPSGYAIGRKMKTQITGLNTATQSSNNGISIVETADGALTEVHEMLQRMNELAVKGETGTLTTTDRMTLEAEVKQLKAEITRISTDTQFNGQTLLDGTYDLRGFTNNHLVRVGYYSDEVPAKKYEIYELAVEYDEEGNIDERYTKLRLSDDFPAGVEIAETTKNKITLKGPLEFEMTLEVERPEEVPGTVAVTGERKFRAPGFNLFYTNYQLDFERSCEDFLSAMKDPYYLTFPMAERLPADCRITAVLPGPDLDDDDPRGSAQDTVIIENDRGFHMEIIMASFRGGNAAGNGTGASGLSTGFPCSIPEESVFVDATGIGTMDIQTGANEGQQLKIRIPEISLNRMNMEDMKMTTVDECAEANKTIKKAILYVSDVRSRLGAYQNRLEHTVNNLAVSNENMTSSYSRIMDVDMAEEMTTYTTEQVISQAAVSMLAQANERPSQVLQLLQ